MMKLINVINAADISVIKEWKWYHWTLAAYDYPSKPCTHIQLLPAMIAKGKGAIIKIVSFRKSALRKRFSKDKIVYGFGIG